MEDLNFKARWQADAAAEIFMERSASSMARLHAKMKAATRAPPSEIFEGLGFMVVAALMPWSFFFYRHQPV